MKNTALILIAFFFCFNLIVAQEYNETVQHTAQFTDASDRLISAHNIYGSIEIIGYSGTTVEVEVDKSIKARSERGLDNAKTELDVKVVEYEGDVLVYYDSPEANFDPDKRRYNHKNNHGFRKRYKAHFDIKIKVPYDTNVEAYAMNDGDIIIRDIRSMDIIVSNLNGKITMENVSGAIDANALNEDIDISYAANPVSDTYVNALNGDVNISVQKGLNAEVHFKSLNGGLYSDIDVVNNTPVVSKKKSKKGKGTKYKISSKKKVKFGSGGPGLYFDLLNGNVNITES